MQGTVDREADRRARAVDLLGERGRTPLMFAVESQAWDIFHYLVGVECDLTLVEEAGKHNALQLALLLGETDAAIAFLNAKKVPEVVFTNRAEKGWTALELATLKEQAGEPAMAEVVRLIKKRHP